MDMNTIIQFKSRINIELTRIPFKITGLHHLPHHHAISFRPRAFY